MGTRIFGCVPSLTSNYFDGVEKFVLVNDKKTLLIYGKDIIEVVWG
ncbi:MAG: hypothetical protein MJZ11_10645 [Lachnospiraceae bacterium]|nr:hypothetical protein [Lachnospiraceae bacterium]